MDLPYIGVGTAHVKARDMDSMLRTALLSASVYHIDCAKVYGNEEAVGTVLKSLFDSGVVSRDQVFLTSKLWNDDHARVEQACRESLKRLQVDSLDLYLIHWPRAWRKGTLFCPDDSVSLEDTWRAMEALVDKGLTKRIGLSNFDETNVKRILRICRIKPYANQLEIHPRLSQPRLVKFNQDNGIRVIAWSPLAKFESIANDPTLLRLAEKHHRTVCQIVLRWHYQRGISTIPRSSKPSRVASNAQILDFELSTDDMREIDNMNKDQRLTRDWIAVFDTTPRFPYKLIDFVVKLLMRAVFFLPFVRIDLKGNPN